MGRRPKTYTIVQEVVRKGFRPSYEPKSKTPMTYKCTRCQQWQVASKMAYDRKRGSHNHVSSWCKKCRQEYMREYRRTHKEQIKITSQAWKDRHKMRLKWRGMYEDKIPRVSHCWITTEETETWTSLCGLTRQYQWLLSRSNQEEHCPICQKLYHGCKKQDENEESG